MVESKRDESSRPALTRPAPADVLRMHVSAAAQSAKLRMFAPQLLPLIGALDAYVFDTESRVAALEAALTANQKRRAEFEKMALRMVETARAEGMLLPPVDRQGGFIEAMDMPL